MKKILCALLSVVMILGVIGCQTATNNNDVPGQTTEIEKVAYTMSRTGNPESGYDWYVSIEDASVIGVEIAKEAMESEPEPEDTVEPTVEPEPTEEPATEKLYYIYSMESEGVNLNLAQIYVSGIDVHDAYILMRNDGTATISFGDGDKFEVKYDDTSFFTETETLNYTMDGENILIDMGTEQAVFAPADIVDAELAAMPETLSQLVTGDNSGCDCDSDTETPVETEPESEPEPTEEPEPEPEQVFVDNTNYTFAFTGIKEGKTVVRLDYQKVENGETVSYGKHEAFRAEVTVEDGKMVVKMEEYEEDANGGSLADAEAVPFEIEKEENASTGYSWSVDIEDVTVLSCEIVPLEAEAQTSEDGEALVGAPSTVKLVFSGLKEGSTIVNLHYTRAWETEDDESSVHETYKAAVSDVDGKLVVNMEKLDNESVDDNGTEPVNIDETINDTADKINGAVGDAVDGEDNNN